MGAKERVDGGLRAVMWSSCQNECIALCLLFIPDKTSHGKHPSPKNPSLPFFYKELSVAEGSRRQRRKGRAKDGTQVFSHNLTNCVYSGLRVLLTSIPLQ